MDRRFQYPILQGPTLPEALQEETIFPDKYHTQTNEPVRLVPFIFAAIFAAGLSFVPVDADSGTGDGTEIAWFIPGPEPVRLDPLDRPDLYCPSIFIGNLDSQDTGPGPEALEWIPETNLPRHLRKALLVYGESKVAPTQEISSTSPLIWLEQTNEPRQLRKALLVYGESKVAPLLETVPSEFEGWFVETNLPPAHLVSMGALFAGHIPNYIVESKTGPAPSEIEWFVETNQPVAHLIPPGRPDLYSPYFFGQRLVDVDTGIGPEGLEWLVSLSQPYPSVKDARSDLHIPASDLVRDPDEPQVDKWFTPFSEPYPYEPDRRASYQEAYLNDNLKVQEVELPDWYTPFSEPVRRDPLDRPDLYTSQITLFLDLQTGVGPEEIEWLTPLSEPIRLDPLARPDLYTPYPALSEFQVPVTGVGPEELEWLSQEIDSIRRDPLDRPDLYSPSFGINIDPIPRISTGVYKPVIRPRRRS